MKKLLLLSITTLLLFAACKDDEGSHMAYMEKIKDTVFKTYPTVAGVTVKVSDDGREITVILGDKQMYNAPEEKQRQTAYEVSKMSLAIFGKENNLTRGSVIISRDEQSEQPASSDSKIINVNIDSLKKAG